MIRCPKCSNLYASNELSCTRCGYFPEKIDGLSAWAPEMAPSGSGFKPEYFAQLAELEASNFWFKARNELIVWALKKYFPDLQTFMEVGCGNGFVLSGVATSYPSARLVGSELFSEGLKFAAQRLPKATFMQMDGRNIPFHDEFDVVGAFDVIEHIPEDEAVLGAIWQAVVPGGGVIFSVPQHPWLWSITDEVACHVRRYTAKELHEKMGMAGFEILRSTSFMALLLPAMYASRIRNNRKQITNQFEHFDELQIAQPLNRALEAILRLERLFIRMGVNFPIGGSRMVIARKVKK